MIFALPTLLCSLSLNTASVMMVAVVVSIAIWVLVRFGAPCFLSPDAHG